MTVLEAELTVMPVDPSTLSVVPAPVKLSPVVPSAVLSCATMPAIGWVRSTPTDSGLAFKPFFSGSAAGSVTLTIEIWCWAFDESV